MACASRWRGSGRRRVRPRVFTADVFFMFHLKVKIKPYAPELNPVKHLWDELREKCFHNLAFKSLSALED